MSEGEAFRRLAAARLATEFPTILDHLQEGTLHLSALVLLRKHLTVKNYERLVQAAVGKTKKEIQQLIADEFPKPDVPPTIRKLPDTPRKKAAREAEARGEHVTSAQPEPKPGSVEPLSEARYKIQFTTDKEFCDDLKELTDLLRHTNPTGDMEIIFKRAVRTLLEDVRKERFGDTEHPRKPTKPTKPGYVARSDVRKVVAREGRSCSFVSEDGTRCGTQAFLELHHVKAKAHGGSDAAENIKIFCREHNQLCAEEDFGRAHVKKRIKERRETANARRSAKRESNAAGLSMASSRGKKASPAKPLKKTSGPAKPLRKSS